MFSGDLIPFFFHFSPANDLKITNEKDGKAGRNNGDKPRFNPHDKRRKNNLIQSEGVFSEGTGLMPLRKSGMLIHKIMFR